MSHPICRILAYIIYLSPTKNRKTFWNKPQPLHPVFFCLSWSIKQKCGQGQGQTTEGFSRNFSKGSTGQPNPNLTDPGWERRELNTFFDQFLQRGGTNDGTTGTNGIFDRWFNPKMPNKKTKDRILEKGGKPVGAAFFSFAGCKFGGGECVHILDKTCLGTRETMNDESTI